jgi:hypothetical protein
MKSSKRIALALMMFGAIFATGCNDTNSSCLAACHHEVLCVLGAGLAGAGYGASYCDSTCSSASDAGYSGCKTPGAAYDCIAGLSCPDLTSAVISDMGPPSPAFLSCVQKAGCDGGYY